MLARSAFVLLAAALACGPAAAIDPPTVKGRLTYDGRVYVLRHIYAWQPPRGDELWIYLTDNPLPATAAQDESMPEQLAREKRFGGAKLVVRSSKPRLEDMKGVVYAPRDDGYAVDRFNFGPSWERLVIGDKRVVGKIKSGWMSWTLDAEFSAPIFGSARKR